MMARRAIAVLLEGLIRCGVDYITSAVQPPSGLGTLDSVKTADGERISAGVFVVAYGAWLPKLLPGLLGRRIYPTRFRLPSIDARSDCLYALNSPSPSPQYTAQLPR
jgi:glycine/D-amino acid oxidase-like deaminating enzyme